MIIMKKLYMLIPVFFFSCMQLYADVLLSNQSYHLRFKDCQADSSRTYFYADIEIKGNFNMGTSNICFDFNQNALSNPVLDSAYFFTAGDYLPMTLTRPLSNVLSLNIVYTGNSGNGTSISDWKKIARVRFTLLFPDSCAHFSFRNHNALLAPTVLLNDAGTRGPAQDTLYDLALCPLIASPTIVVKLILEGPYDSVSGKMKNNAIFRDSLLTKQSSQPYAAAPWYYQGQESISSVPSNIIDWILIVLRSETGAASSFDTLAVLLRDDGYLVNTSSFDSLLHFPSTIHNSYYVLIYHRNHLPLMSAFKMGREYGRYFHDFSSDASHTYAQGANHIKALGSNGTAPFAMFAGNANGDLNINTIDFIIWVSKNGHVSYHPADFNLDININALDYLIFMNNNGKSSHVPQ
jgi:hypothetical protein